MCRTRDFGRDRASTHARRLRYPAISALACAMLVVLVNEPSAARPPSHPFCPPASGDRDNKTSSGLICVVDQPSSYWSSSYSYSWRGGICNRSDSLPLKVRCPIIRDAVGNSNGLGCVEIVFRDEDYQADDIAIREAECVLRAVQDDGDFIIDGYSVRTNQVPNDYLELYLNESSPGGTYYVSCNLPPRGYSGDDFCLQSLNWSERAPTD